MRFVNITARSENGGLLSALSGSGATNITFENVHVKIETWGNYSQGPQPCYADPPTCTNEDPPKCVAHPLPTGAAMTCMGSRDYRPVPVGVPGRYATRAPAHADGIFLENAHGIRFRNVSFEFETPRKPWFGTCLSVDKHSTHIVGAKDIKCINGGGV